VCTLGDVEVARSLSNRTGVELRRDSLADLSELARQVCRDGIGAGAYSGYSLAVAKNDDIIAVAEGSLLDGFARLNSVFDLASLSKVIGTWTTIADLLESGAIERETSVRDVYPESAGRPIATVTVEQLLTHTARVLPRSNLRQYGSTRQEIETGVMTADLDDTQELGEVRYADRSALMLGFIAEKVTHKSLDQLAHSCWSRLGCAGGLRYGPIDRLELPSVIPGGLDDSTHTEWRGVVHDLSTRMLGGVSGVSGVFGNVFGVANYLQGLTHCLDGTVGVGVQAVVRDSMTVQAGNLESGTARGFGWAMKSDSLAFHYGFTGGAIWLDRNTLEYAVLLTNSLRFAGRRNEALGEVRSKIGGLLSARRGHD
jgi:CubicO group peptidase (beta-lactamase class C family)